MELPLHQILLDESYKKIDLCSQLDDTVISEHLKAIFTMYTKKKPGKEAKSFNGSLLNLLKDIDIVPIIVSVKDAVVIAQLLAD